MLQRIASYTDRGSYVLTTPLSGADDCSVKHYDVELPWRPTMPHALFHHRRWSVRNCDCSSTHEASATRGERCLEAAGLYRLTKINVRLERVTRRDVTLGGHDVTPATLPTLIEISRDNIGEGDGEGGLEKKTVKVDR